ncbi:MAG: hypothetical protein WC859_08530 [Elusimicrobiota bacterium]
MDSLLLGPDVVARYKSFDPSLRISSRGADDGQYVYSILYDPLLIKRNNLDLFDNASYRYHRILYPWMAYVLSGSLPRCFPYALLLINLASYVTGAFVARRLSCRLQWPSWVVVAGYLSISGLVYSVFRSLTEPLALTLVIAGLCAEAEGRHRLAVVSFASSVLAREISITVPLTVYLFQLIEGKFLRREVLIKISLVLLPALLWWGYVGFCLPGQSSFGIPSWSPPSFGWGRFTLPFLGMWQEGVFGWRHLTTATELKRTLSLLIVSGGLVLISWVGFSIKRTLWSCLAASQGLFIVLLRGDLWNYHAGSSRVVIPFFFLLIAWIADELKCVFGSFGRLKANDKSGVSPLRPPFTS